MIKSFFYTLKQSLLQLVRNKTMALTSLFSITAMLLILGMFFILAAFFTYTGIIGRNFLAADILIFALSVFVTFLSSRYLEVRCPSLNLPLLANYALLLLIVTCFFSFTFSPPGLPMFQSPV